MNKSKSLIWTLTIFVLIVLALVVHNRWTVPRISNDQRKQLVALENIVQGNGVTYQFVAEGNDKPFLNNSFPMGYYIVTLPVYTLFGDALLAHRLLEIVGLLLLVYQLYLLGNWLETRYQIKHAALWLLAFSLVQLNPWRASGFSDIWSLMLLVASIRLGLKYTKFSIWQLMVIGILSYATVSMRYAYYPLAFIPVLLLIFKLPVRNIKTYVPLITLVILIGATMVFNKIYFADLDHIESQFDKQRWFFSHLKQMDPVGFNAFFSDHVIFGALGLERWGVNTHWGMKFIILFISLTVLVFLLFATFKTFRIHKKNIFNGENVFPLGIWITIFATVGFISAISVYYPSKQETFLYTWQLISRYMAPAYIALQILLVVLVFRDTNRFRNIFLRMVFVGSMVFQMAYFGSFLFKFSMADTWENYVQFYGLSEMPDVMANYKKLLADPNLKLEIPESQWNYDYLSIYYLTGPDRLTEYLKVNCPDCLEFYSETELKE